MSFFVMQIFQSILMSFFLTAYNSVTSALKELWQINQVLRLQLGK